MTGSKMVQIIPPGARQVAPGVFQAARHRASGGGRAHHAKKHHARGGFRQASMFGGSAAKALVLLQQVSGRLPNGISPGMFLFQYGMSKHNLGIANIGKFLWLQSLAQSNPAMLQFLSLDPMMGMFGFGGGAGGASAMPGFGGGFGGGPVRNETPAPAPSNVLPTADEIQSATALANALSQFA